MADKNHAGYPSNSVTLVTNQIIKMLCFDATEPSNGNSDRRNYGNNRYIYSNLRQWLNSPAAAGQWYTAQHSADQTPDSSHVWSGFNAYSGLAGFLNAFTANERAALLNTTITVSKSSTDGGGTETCTDKIFPLSCTEVGLSGDHVCGSKLAIFSDNNSRIATVTASCVANSNYSSNPGSGAAWYYWLRDAYAGSVDSARLVLTDGTLDGNYAYIGYYGLRPACNLSSDLLISDSVDSDGCYTVIYNQAPTAPSSITVPSEVLGGENLSISWAASTDPDGNLSGYVLERKVGSGTWAQVYKGSARTYTDTITYGWTSVQYRVKAYDAAGAESAYTTSVTRTVTNNRPPVISGTDGVQSHTETLWKLLERYQVPVFLFVNKMDLAGADKAAVLEQLQTAGIATTPVAWSETAFFCTDSTTEAQLQALSCYENGAICKVFPRCCRRLCCSRSRNRKF